MSAWPGGRAFTVGDKEAEAGVRGGREAGAVIPISIRGGCVSEIYIKTVPTIFPASEI